MNLSPGNLENVVPSWVGWVSYWTRYISFLFLLFLVRKLIQIFQSKYIHVQFLNSYFPAVLYLNHLFWLLQASCFHVYVYPEKIHFSPLSIFSSLWTNWILISSSGQAQPLDRCGAQTASAKEQFKLAKWFSDTPVSQQLCPAFPVPKAGSHLSCALSSSHWLLAV